MGMNKLKLVSNIVSVGLIALCLTFASWVLLSYPVSTPVNSYLYSVNVTADPSSSGSWQNSIPSEINNTEKASNVSLLDVQQPLATQKGRDEALQQNKEVGDKQKADDGKNDQPLSQSTNKNTTNSSSQSSLGGSWQNSIPSEIKNNAFNVSLLDVQQPLATQKDRDEALQQNKEVGDKQKADGGKNDQPLSQSTNKNTTNSSSQSSLGGSWQNSIPSEIKNNAFNFSLLDVQQPLATQKDRDEVLQQNKEVGDKQRADDRKIDQPLSQSANKNTTKSSSKSSLGECDLFHGEWFYDESGALYTNKSCPIIIDKQNCQANGRPDRGFESWRWKPSQCVLPKFDANKFLELMSGKTLAFFGDSIAYNHMTSLVCILWQVEVPERRGSGRINRWYFKSRSVSIVRIWSAWLVKQTVSAFKDIPEGIPKVFLDIPHETLMKHAPKFDIIVVSSGHWFADTKKCVFVNKNEVVGGQLWAPPNGHKLHVNNVEAFRIALDTSITALAMHPNYTGITILRSYSPDHYGGGAWNTGGTCMGKVEPARPDQLVKNGFTNVMHEKQVTGFNQAVKKRTNGSKMRLMDITKAFLYRHDGHPGPYLTNDPIKRTMLGPNVHLHPQDCVHWCTPGPIDTWNEFLIEIIRREFEK